MQQRQLTAWLRLPRLRLPWLRLTIIIQRNQENQKQRRESNKLLIASQQD